MKRHILQEENIQDLPVWISSNVTSKIDAILKYNQDSYDKVCQWMEYINGLKKYISHPQIAFDYANRYQHYRNGAIHLVELEYDVEFINKTDKYGRLCVYVFALKSNAPKYGLQLPPDLNESLQIINHSKDGTRIYRLFMLNELNKKKKLYTNMKQRIRLTEGQLNRVIKESVKRIIREDDDTLNQQESCYQTICSLESDLETIIHNTDSSANQIFGGSDDKLMELANRLSHVDTELALQSQQTFAKLLEVISELRDIRIALKTLNSKDDYWGHNFKTPMGTVGYSNQR